MAYPTGVIWSEWNTTFRKMMANRWHRIPHPPVSPELQILCMQTCADHEFAHLWPAACLSDLPWPCFCFLRLASQLNLVRQTFISPFLSVVCMPFPGSAHDHDKVEVYFQFACRKLAWLALASLECGTTLTCQQFFARVGLDTWIIGHQTSSHIYDISS